MALKEYIATSMIIVDRDRTPVDETHVAALAESIARVGLINPITIWRPVRYSTPKLVAGAHRLAAAKRLGWKEIDCIVLEGTAEDERAATNVAIAEIDENLIRRDLSPAERADLTARRKELFEVEHPETKHGATGKGRAKSAQVAHSNERFTKDVAARTGRHEASVRRDAARGKSLGTATLSRIKGTSLDRGAALDALAKLPEPEREDVVSRAERGEPVALPRPPVERKPDPVSRAATRTTTEVVGDDLQIRRARKLLLVSEMEDKAKSGLRYTVNMKRKPSPTYHAQQVAAAEMDVALWVELREEIERLYGVAVGEAEKIVEEAEEVVD